MIYYALGAIVGLGCLTWWVVVRYRLVVPRLPSATPITPEDLLPGDLVFMSGSSWTEKTVQTVTASPFSHVGMVITDESTTEPHLWESDVSGSQVKGPRMVPLSVKLREWPGSPRVFVRRPLTFKMTSEIIESAGKLLGSPFDSSMLAWLFPRWDWWVSLTKTPGSWFCSELVAATLVQGGVSLPDPPRAYSPGRLWDLPGMGPPRELVYPTNKV